MDGEKHLLIVVPWVVGPLTVAVFDEKKTELPGVSAGGEVRPGGRVRVIPACPRGSRREVVAQLAAGRNHRRAFFHRPVIQGVDRQAVPVNNLRAATLVHHINRHRYAFAHA